ncbi:MAG: hypothetical protein EZS28_034079 [Streblomastix strix]|uniref:Uncharacterized protein n=1 Tax=Streblomastix strix TaxID=222440 RepID=A0A5J4UKT5_9EUKA|nr:MAG: hypothetical protein EZS28_034079 [Streblomastix strix]
MITSIERNQLRMSKSKKQIQDMKKELSEEDRLKQQSIDQALRNLSAPQQETKQVDIINEHEVKTKRIMKFIIETIWRTSTRRRQREDFIFSSDNFLKLIQLITQENEEDIEIVFEEHIIQSHSCMSKKFKKKDLVREQDILIKNVSFKVMDNALQNTIEKLYRVNVDLVRLTDVIESDIDKNEF